MRTWKLLEAILIPLSVGLMLATWLAGALHILTRALDAGQEPLSLLTLTGLWLAAVYLTRWASWMDWSMRTGQIVVTIAGLLALWLTIGGHWLNELTGSAIMNALAIGWLWWRGILAGRETFSYSQVNRAFRIGIAAWIGALFLAYALQADFRELASWLVVFFLTALSALAITSLLAALQEEKLPTDVSLALNRYWLGLTGMLIAVIILGGLLVSAVISPEVVGAVLRFLQPVLDLLARGISAIFYVLVVIVFWFVTPIIEYLEKARPGQPLVLSTNAIASLQQQAKQTTEGQAQPPVWLTNLAQILFLILVLGLVGLLFARTFQRFRYSEDEGVEEEREMIGSWSLLKSQLAGLLRRLGSNAPAGPPGPRFLPLAGNDARQRIRAIYQQPLGAAAGAGYARSPDQTPSEYQRTLQNWAPQADDALSSITSAYLEARYSRAEAPDERASLVERAWQRLKEGVHRTGS